MKQETADAEEDVLDKLIRIIQSFVPQPKPVRACMHACVYWDD